MRAIEEHSSDQPSAPSPVPAWVDRQAYPFTVRTLALPAGRLSYVDEGSGPPILFVHGTPTWSFEYRHLIRALAPHHRCIAPDHLGFGLSSRPRTFDYRPESHAINLGAFVDAIGLRRFSLVVHDFGGPIGLPLALAGRVDRLVVLNSWMWPFDDDPKMRTRARMAGGWLGWMLYRYLNFSLKVLTPSAYGDRRKLTPEIHRQYLAPFLGDRDARTRVLWALARALLGSSAHYQSLWEARDRLRGIPTLVMWGMKDRAFEPTQLARWRAALPHAGVLEFTEAGHWPHEEAPQDVAAALGRFLASEAAGAPKVISSARTA
jgi:haloalkane dehalogenase